MDFGVSRWAVALKKYQIQYAWSIPKMFTLKLFTSMYYFRAGHTKHRIFMPRARRSPLWGKLEYEKLPKTGIEILPSKPSNPGNGIFGGSPVVKPPFWTWLIVFAKIGASLSAAKGQRPKNYFSCCCDSY